MFRPRCQLSRGFGLRLLLTGLGLCTPWSTPQAAASSPVLVRGVLRSQPQLDQLELDGGHRVHLRYPARCQNDLERLKPAIARQRQPSEIVDNPWRSASMTVELDIRPATPGRRRLRMTLRFSGQGQGMRRELSDVDCGLLVDSAATLIALALDGDPQHELVWEDIKDPPPALVTEPMGEPWVDPEPNVSAKPASRTAAPGHRDHRLEPSEPPEPTVVVRTRRKPSRPRKPPRRPWTPTPARSQPKLQLAVGPGFAGGIAPGNAAALSFALELPRGRLRFAFALHTRLRPTQAAREIHGLRLNLTELTTSFGLCLVARTNPVFAEICLQPELGTWRVSATGSSRSAAAQWTPYASLSMLPGLSYWPTPRFGLRLRSGVAVSLLQPRFHAGTPKRNALAAKAFGYRSGLELVFAI